MKLENVEVLKWQFFAILEALDSVDLVNFSLQKNSVFLISRKISMTEKFSNFHTVCKQSYKCFVKSIQYSIFELKWFFFSWNHLIFSNFQLGAFTINWYPFLIHGFFVSLFSSLIGPFGGFLASGLKRACKQKVFFSSNHLKFEFTIVWKLQNFSVTQILREIKVGWC